MSFDGRMLLEKTKDKKEATIKHDESQFGKMLVPSEIALIRQSMSAQKINEVY